MYKSNIMASLILTVGLLGVSYISQTQFWLINNKSWSSTTRTTRKCTLLGFMSLFLATVLVSYWKPWMTFEDQPHLISNNFTQSSCHWRSHLAFMPGLTSTVLSELATTRTNTSPASGWFCLFKYLFTRSSMYIPSRVDCSPTVDKQETLSNTEEKSSLH